MVSAPDPAPAEAAAEAARRTAAFGQFCGPLGPDDLEEPLGVEIPRPFADPKRFYFALLIEHSPWCQEHLPAIPAARPSDPAAPSRPPRRPQAASRLQGCQMQIEVGDDQIFFGYSAAGHRVERRGVARPGWWFSSTGSAWVACMIHRTAVAAHRRSARCPVPGARVPAAQAQVPQLPAAHPGGTCSDAPRRGPAAYLEAKKEDEKNWSEDEQEGWAPRRRWAAAVVPASAARRCRDRGGGGPCRRAGQRRLRKATAEVERVPRRRAAGASSTSGSPGSPEPTSRRRLVNAESRSRRRASRRIFGSTRGQGRLSLEEPPRSLVVHGVVRPTSPDGSGARGDGVASCWRRDVPGGSKEEKATAAEDARPDRASPGRPDQGRRRLFPSRPAPPPPRTPLQQMSSLRAAAEYEEHRRARTSAAGDCRRCRGFEIIAFAVPRAR